MNPEGYFVLLSFCLWLVGCKKSHRSQAVDTRGLAAVEKLSTRNFTLVILEKRGQSGQRNGLFDGLGVFFSKFQLKNPNPA